MNKNGILFRANNKLIDNNALAALTIMIAESDPKEKETMVAVVMNCLTL
ncbi:MAG: hypothetical protein MJ189_05655 [Coriobacteriales bacterium]|nr:hypothetical protein [Coriobacteriales bacterium]